MSKKTIITLANDLAMNKVENYSAEESNEVLRSAFNQLLGMEEGYDAKISRRAFRRNKTAIFEIIEEVLDKNLDRDLRNQFEDWVEYRNFARGDKPSFYTPDEQIFKIALISDGNQNLLRQRIRGGQAFTISTNNYGVKIYEELDRFLAGHIDWNAMVANVSFSFALQVRDDIMGAIIKQFSQVGAEYKSTTIGADQTGEAELIGLAQKVKARTRQEVSIYGTKLALHKIKPNVTSDAQDGERNATGFYSQIAGIPMYELEQSFDSKGDMMLEDDFVLILPETRDKMIKVVNEGESYMQEGTPEGNASMDLEYTMINRMGIAIIPSSVYGYATFS